MNRFFNCNYNLYLWKIKTSPKCDFCCETDTVEHYFFTCKIVKKFWVSLEKWLADISGVQMNFVILEILFGTNIEDVYNYARNYIILQAKAFIYNCKKEKKDLFVLEFLVILKKNVSIENEIACKKGKQGWLTRL